MMLTEKYRKGTPDITLLGDDEMDLLKQGYAVVDTEDDGKGGVYMYGVYSADGFKYFTRRDGFINYITALRVKYVLCYNLMYDAFNIFGYDLLQMKGFFIRSRLAKLNACKKVWLCAYNHWNISIADAGDELGIPKLKADYKKRVSVKYLEHDCKIGYLYAQKMLVVYAQYDIPYRLTIASTALHHFLNDTKLLPAITEFSDALYAGYYGGRVSCFRQSWIEGYKKTRCIVDGKTTYEKTPIYHAFKNCYKYDINSAYPYVMVENKYPYPLAVQYGIDLDKSGMTCATVYSDLAIPLLPYRTDKGELCYPNGTFTGTWCNNELKYFLSIGGEITKYHSGIYFNEDAYVFSDYFKRLYKYRLAARTYFDKTTWKLFLNSIYGKFAQRGIDTKIVSIDDALAQNLTGDMIGDSVLITRPGKRPDYANVIWSAMITANVRVYLHKMLRLFGASHILYCDTDSIISDIPMDKQFIHGTDLGAWKYEGAGDCEIIAPKMYRFGTDVKVKGVPKKVVAEAGLVSSYSYARPVKLFEGLHRNIRPNTWLQPSADKPTKTLTGKLSNCAVDKHGNVKPLILKGD